MTVENQNQSNHKANQGREQDQTQTSIWFYKTSQRDEQTQSRVYLCLLANGISSCHRLANQIQVWRKKTKLITWKTVAEFASEMEMLVILPFTMMPIGI